MACRQSKELALIKSMGSSLVPHLLWSCSPFPHDLLRCACHFNWPRILPANTFPEGAVVEELSCIVSYYLRDDAAYTHTSMFPLGSSVALCCCATTVESRCHMTLPVDFSMMITAETLLKLARIFPSSSGLEKSINSVSKIKKNKIY